MEVIHRIQKAKSLTQHFEEVIIHTLCRSRIKGVFTKASDHLAHVFKFMFKTSLNVKEIKSEPTQRGSLT